MALKEIPIDIGNRVEMFVDNHLVFKTFGTSLKMAVPEKKEIAFRMDQPWEGSGSGPYASTFFDGEKYRMYYRGCAFDEDASKGDESESQHTCYAESTDGIHWEKPELGLVEFRGNKNNNIIFSGKMAHNFTPMMDSNPHCKLDEKFKATAGHAPEGLMAYKSLDGIRWSELLDRPVMTKGAFDSQNLCFYDENQNNYRCYSRYFMVPDDPDFEQQFGYGIVNVGIRSIQSCISEDFRIWTDPVPNQYGEGVPSEQFYTNATVLCPGAPHHYLSFPMRFMSERFKVEGHPYPGVSDAVFLSGRDGVHFERPFLEAWIRPDLDQKNWTQRNYITTWGILETSPEEFSLYVWEHYRWEDAYVRRYAVRKHGFASMNAPYAGGMFVTKPLIFDGSNLFLNYATSAPGSIKVGIVGDETDWPAPGYSTEDCDIIYGNELDKMVTWKGEGDLSRFRGNSIRLKFEMKDADLYSIHFHDEKSVI